MALKCFQCGGLSGFPCSEFDINKMEYQKVCNNTVQSCITSYSNGSKYFLSSIITAAFNKIFCLFLLAEVSLRDCWTNKAETTTCDGVKNVLMLCMCAKDFCNCHNSPELNGDSCPQPPSGASLAQCSLVIPFCLLVMLIQLK